MAMITDGTSEFSETPDTVINRAIESKENKQERDRISSSDSKRIREVQGAPCLCASLVDFVFQSSARAAVQN